MMNRYRYLNLAAIVVLVLAVQGCAYPIAKSLRQQARKDLTFAMVYDNPDAYRGAIVIWGGTILRTDNESTGTAITVLQFPLDWWGRPKTWDEAGGRFIVTVDRLLDPEIYWPGRHIIVAGEITGAHAQPLGRASYRYPVLAARQIHLWPLYYGFPGYWYPYSPWGYDGYGTYYYAPYSYAPYYRRPYYGYSGPYDYWGPYYNWWMLEPYGGGEWRGRGEFRERDRRERGENGEFGRDGREGDGGRDGRHR